MAGVAVEQIKDRLSIQDVVSSYIKLERAGKNLRARCPFHNEKTPSFFVSPDRNVYHCFGCGRGGDVFTFVQEFEGLDFTGALKVLADRAGVELTPVDPRVQEERDRLLALLTDAREYFAAQLIKHSEARAYLQNRGVTEEIQNAFGLGYAEGPPTGGWRALYDTFSKKGYTDEELEKAGLIKRAEGNKHYDTFRARIMFPITDAAGRTIAFSGRSFPDTPARDASAGKTGAPKYLNTPETQLFSKSQVLYGFDVAKREIRRYDFVTVVEGQIDVLLAHKIGYRNTVAPLGTSLTRAHLSRLRQITRNILFAFDADAAGLASFKRAAGLALALDFDVKAVCLPDGKDPADVISSDPDAWKEMVKGGIHTIDFLLAILRGAHTDDRSRAQAVTREVLPFVARIASSIDKAHFVRRIAEELSVPESAIYEELENIQTDEPEAEVPIEASVVSPYNRGAMAHERIVALILWQDGLAESHIATTPFKERLTKLLGSDGGSALELRSDRQQEHTFEAEMTLPTAEAVERHIEELFLILEEDLLHQKLEGTLAELKEAEKENNTSRVEELLGRTQKLAQNIEVLRQTLQHAE